MLFPRESDADKRQRWIAAFKLLNYSEIESNEPIPAATRTWLAELWKLDQSPRRTLHDGLDRVSRAFVCGMILHRLLILRKHHPRHFGVGRAIVLLEMEAEQVDLPTSESSAKKAWAYFKPVSHFWSAMVFTVATIEGGLLPVLVSEIAFSDFLALAEGFREAAESAGLVRRREVWSLPAELAPESTEIEFPPLADDLLGFLDSLFPDY